MKKTALIAAVCLLTTSLFAQMKKPQSQAPAPDAKKRMPVVVSGARNNAGPTFARISIDDAVKLQKSGQAVFIDVRSNEQFQKGHIKGAYSIPGSQLIRRFGEVPPRKTVITYCACTAEQSSGRAAADLVAHGVKNVFALKGGWSDWKDRGLPMGTGAR